MREVLDHAVDVAAVGFDVDGTMYRQGPVRRAMITRLARAHAVRPVSGVRLLRVISAYRKAQEDLRASGFEGDVTTAQVEAAAARTGVDADVVRASIEQWMEISPLNAVAASVRPGLTDVLDELAGRGVKLGAVSDYPAAAKLAALGIADRFDIVLSAQDPRVHAFKPNPKGLLVALAELGVAPADALYVGDRTDVDAPAAAAAEMRFVLVGASGGAAGPDRTTRRRAVTPRLESP